jgi:hypothetical protein
MADKVDGEKRRRTRKCREIVAVTLRESGFDVVEGWPAGITRADKAVAAAKKIQTEWAKSPETPGKQLSDIILMRRLATVKGSSQTVMAFTVE